MISPKIGRLYAYGLFIAKIRDRFRTSCSIQLPRDLHDIVFEYYKPTDIEHFAYVLQTGFIKGTLKLSSGQSSTLIIASSGDGIVFKGFRGKSALYGFHRIHRIMSEYDIGRLWGIVGVQLMIMHPDAEWGDWGIVYPIEHQSSLEKQMYRSFKRAAAKLMYQWLRSKNQ
jgi:hypothetical protein